MKKMGSEAKRNGIVNNEGFKSRVDRYLHSGDTKHVMAGMAIITLVFGVPWFLMNRGWLSFLLILYHIYIYMPLNRLGCFNISFGLVGQ